jgi:hypothetical protein
VREERASIAGIAGAIIGTASTVADFDQTFSFEEGEIANVAKQPELLQKP